MNLEAINIKEGKKMSGELLELKNIKKNFGETDVLKGITLSIQKGEFLTFLGASGCGKTTTLRIIAGLEAPEEGQVLLEGKDVTDLPPNRRDINTVFQNYALFPHMNVEANIGYGLRIKKRPKAEIRDRVKNMLELVQLEGYEKRMPAELSGGQKQRVAIARALASRPSIILADEPTGNLDSRTELEVIALLKTCVTKYGQTLVMITHDETIAQMADEIIVIEDGKVVTAE